MTIMVTRPREQAQAMTALLEQRGAAVYVFPTVEIRLLEDYTAVDAALASSIGYDWLVLTSVNGVEMLARRAAGLGLDLTARFATSQIAAIGPQTAAALQSLGLSVDLMPSQHVGEALAEALIARGVAGQRLLILRSELAREALIEQLEAAGARPEAFAVYTAVPPSDTDVAAAARVLAAGQIDLLSFASASAVENFAACFDVEALPALLARVRIACIGPITSQRALALLGRVDLQASEYSIPGLVNAMLAQEVPA